MIRISRILIVVLTATAVAWSAPVSAAGGDSDSSTPSPVRQARDLLNNKQYEAAIPLLTSSLATSPDDADAWNLLGYATRRLGRFEEAEGYYMKALAIDDGHKQALEYLGMLYVETQRMADAEAILARLDDACFFGCEEFDDLKAAIESGRAYKN